MAAPAAQPAWAVVPRTEDDGYTWNEVVRVEVLAPSLLGYRVRFADGSTDLLVPAQVRAADDIDARFRWQEVPA